MKNILAAIVLPILVYLIGAFYNVSFDISVWSAESRFVIALFMVYGAVMGLMMPKNFFGVSNDT